MLDQQHAVITGGGKGIGAAIAQVLSKRGANITLMGRHLNVLESTARSLTQAQALVCDVSDEEQVTLAFSQAVEKFGPVSILINNAGIASSAPFHKQALGEYRKLLDVNLLGAFLCTQTVLPGMLDQQSGRIVNIASMAGLHGNPYITAYSASKHGMIGMTKCLALEVAGKNITVNAICPGYTDTEMAHQAIDTVMAKTGCDEAKARKIIVRDNPQGRMIQPEEVAQMVAWLCMPEASGITGQAIEIA